jgi:hypothetical protein
MHSQTHTHKILLPQQQRQQQHGITIYWIEKLYTKTAILQTLLVLYYILPFYYLYLLQLAHRIFKKNPLWEDMNSTKIQYFAFHLKWGRCVASLNFVQLKLHIYIFSHPIERLGIDPITIVYERITFLP